MTTIYCRTMRYMQEDELKHVRKVASECFDGPIAIEHGSPQYVVIARDDHNQKLVGCATVKFHQSREQHALVENVCILPQYRRKKIGSALMQFIFRVAAVSSECVALMVDAESPCYTHVVRFYTQNGFKDTNTIPGWDSDTQHVCRKTREPFHLYLHTERPTHRIMVRLRHYNV